MSVFFRKTVSKVEKEKLLWEERVLPFICLVYLFYIFVCKCEISSCLPFEKPSRFQINVCFVKRGFRTKLWRQEEALPFDNSLFLLLFLAIYIFALLLLSLVIIIFCKLIKMKVGEIKMHCISIGLIILQHMHLFVRV